MQIVVTLSEKDYYVLITANDDKLPSMTARRHLFAQLKEGTLLSKEHGRLGDLDELEKRINNYIKQHAHMMDEFTILNAKFILEGIKDTPTIIEADKAGDTDGNSRGCN